ncbi:Oxalate decarboxylase OxdD [Methylocella tundrae]|uniref:Oxalate decarboxylase OxdD n=1 Tax=Methylocella tundrae TaxID=227605 RepID=A0A8B6M3N9_METTU|nr:cupin domain-containing protein [Methylocella tundrae]VTZ24717.1 Oxalate decarboxylase OxdD [Methylocella tundrae]VTZ49438.1 Oxalate decarboxylase OxdD [Methylocella tundrae]
MDHLSRRMLLALSAVGGAVAAAAGANAAAFGNPDEPAEGAINSTPGAISDPGPQNPALESQFPSFQNPPPTDIGDMPMFWSSFNNAHKRIQAGGWAREVTAENFPISKEISGVNMRLGPGGIRELHWHLAAEWGLITNGSCRVTVLDELGRAYVQDVKEGEIWYFPAGQPHSLQGLGPDGCEFLIVFDDGKASEFNTLLLTDLMAHTPPDILAQNFSVPAETFKSIPLHDLWIFQGKEPGSLAADQAAVNSGEAPPNPFTFSLSGSKPVKENRSGVIHLADSRTFKVSTTITAALETLKPGALRRMHWHPNADEWQYWIKGEGRMTVYDAGPRAQTADFRAGDVGYVPKSQAHYIQNTGAGELQFLTIFKAPVYQEVDVSDWLRRTPPELVAQHLNVDPAEIAKFPQGQLGLEAG